MNTLEQRLQRRRRRKQHFDTFYNKAKDEFGRIAAADPRAEHFNSLNSLCICPGGRGGTDDRCVEVFFGNRPFDRAERIELIDGRLQRSVVLEGEFGAALQYYRQDDDRVIVFLQRAGTRKSQNGPTIILAKVGDPEKLKHPRILKRHWNYLMAMMEFTSIDGVPTPMDRLRYFWLWITRYELKDNKANRARFWRPMGIVGSFFFAVGFSGWVIELWPHVVPTAQSFHMCAVDPLIWLWSSLPMTVRAASVLIWLNLLSAGLGVAGTLLLFFGTYGLQPLEGSPFGSEPLQKYNAEITAKNRVRIVRQKCGLILLCLSFAAQALAVFLS